MSRMTGHFAVTGVWTTISSPMEGEFRERLAPGSLRRTIAEDRQAMRVLFAHGRNAMIGDRPLGVIDELEEDTVGARYAVDLFDDASYVHDLIPGLKHGQYGASFRFSAIAEDFNMKPGRSAGNPRGIPERTLTEIRVAEFGPCTFAAYPEASATARAKAGELVPTGGREEIVDRSLVGASRGEPITLRRLRREAHKPGAARLLNEIRAGRAVSIRWDRLDETRTTTIGLYLGKTKKNWLLSTGKNRGPTPGYLLTTAAPTWRL